MKKYRFSSASKIDKFRSKIFDFKLIGGKFSLGNKVRTDNWVPNMEVIYKQVLQNNCKRIFKKSRIANHALYRKMTSVNSRLWFTLDNPKRALGVLVTDNRIENTDVVYNSTHQVICYYSEVTGKMLFSTMEQLLENIRLNHVKGCKLSDKKYWGMGIIRHEYTIGTLPTGKPLMVHSKLTDVGDIYYGHHTHYLSEFGIFDLPTST